MFGVTDITTYIIGVVIVVLVPGPNSLFVLSVASRKGVAAGYRAACGVFVGDLVLMILTAIGMASLLRSQPGLFSIVKFVGAAYLAWLGVGMLRAALADWRRDVAFVMADKPVQGSAYPFTRALTISLLNPKAILFFVSFFVQFVDPTYAYPGVSFAILGAIVQIASFLYLSTLIFVGHRLAAAFRARRRLAAGATGGVGALFLSFSARLATATAG